MNTYKVISDGSQVLAGAPGKYAGNSNAKIFGRLDCKTGMRMRKEHRVFFAELEDAVKVGYRPCKNCEPITEAEFSRLRRLIRK